MGDKRAGRCVTLLVSLSAALCACWETGKLFPGRATLTTGTLCISPRSTVWGHLVVDIEARRRQARRAMPWVLYQQWLEKRADWLGFA